MGEIRYCLPYGMEKALRDMERQGWRIISARGDTGYALLGYYGSATAFKWNGEELVALGGNRARVSVMKKSQDRIHLYYPVKDQEALEEAVRLSRFDSASSLIRELVRRYLRQRQRRVRPSRGC